MLERYTHPTDTRKLDALDTFSILDGQSLGSQQTDSDQAQSKSAELLGDFGGRRGSRTPDLRVANAALSQLS